MKVSTVECWQLRRNADDEDANQGGSKKKGSVLDCAQDRHVMSLAGMKVNHSDGLRAEEPIE